MLTHTTSYWMIDNAKEALSLSFPLSLFSQAGVNPSRIAETDGEPRRGQGDICRTGTEDWNILG